MWQISKGDFIHCRLSGSVETLRRKCWWFLVNTQNWQFRAALGPGRAKCPKHSEEGLPWARWRLISAALSLPAWTGAFVFVKNWIVRDQISVELMVHILSFLIPTSLVTISVNLFCHTQNVTPVTWKSIPLTLVKELGEQTSFSYCSQLLSLCSSELVPLLVPRLRRQLVICSIWYLSHLSCAAKLAQVLKITCHYNNLVTVEWNLSSKIRYKVLRYWGGCE